MTIINTNSISGINSITAQGASGLEFFDSSGNSVQTVTGDGLTVGTGATISGATNTITASTNGSEALRIDSAGKIGVNNSSPLYAMHFKNAMASSPSFIHMEVTGSNILGGGGGIAFDTSASNTASNNSLFLATISGERNSANDGSNDLVFKTSKSLVDGDDGVASTPKEKLRITSDGKLVLPTNSPGIQFGTPDNPAASGGIDILSQTLDDYEEGTWSPQIKGWNGSYTISEGGYIKIGRQVFISGEVKTNATTGTSVDTWPGLSNLPFVNTTAFHPVGGSQRYMGSATLLGDVSPSGSGMAFVTFDRNDDTSFFPNHITPSGAFNFQNTMINNITTTDFGMRFNCTYFTD